MQIDRIYAQERLTSYNENMNLRLRLEKLCDSRGWTRLGFADGTAIIGRLLRIGQDYVELETYGDPDKGGVSESEYSRHLIPLGLIKIVTVESPIFAECERRRLNYLSRLDSNQDAPEMEL
ncbi:MAG: hypothetical protein BWY75_02192 [bacterium ADurb.Bin425]|nr:MAG: hypothetical protein BWY75_02192 [bacterium ADurb.Bin425]